MCQLRVFMKKCNKSTDNDKISNRRDTFREDIELENSECAEEWVKQKEEVSKNNMTKEIEKEREK